jgi:uncharacterized membrane protein
MGFLYSTLPLWVAIGGWIVALGTLVLAGWRKPFKKLANDALQHLWLSTVVTLAVLWAFDIWVQDGAILHLLGATLMVTLFGWALALIGTCVVVVLVALILGAPWEGIGLTMLVLGAVPVALSALIQYALSAKFPHRRSVFILGNGVATSILAVMASGITALLVHVLLRDLEWRVIISPFLISSAVLAIGEAVFTGAMTAIIAVYKPAWMKTFDKRLNQIDR